MTEYVMCPKCSGMGEYHDEINCPMGREKLVECDMCHGQQELKVNEKDVKYSISKIADTLISHSSYKYSLEEVWNESVPAEMRKNFTFEEVKKYIDDKVSLGNKYINL